MLRNIINLGGRLLIVCLVAAVALAATYNITAPVKAANDAAIAEKARKAIYPDAASFTVLSQEETDSLVASDKDFSGVKSVYRADDGGVLVTLTVTGYHEFTLLVGIKPDATVAGFSVLAHTETAGLGDRITSSAFVNQFKGIATPAAYGDGIEAISGATFSSKGVLNGINIAARVAKQLGKE
jgi:electron transport complex protein RnfG